MKTAKIDEIVVPFTKETASKQIGRYIKKREGVFNDSDNSVYKIVGITETGFNFWVKDYFYKGYLFENIIYDYVFEDDTYIGITGESYLKVLRGK